MASLDKHKKQLPSDGWAAEGHVGGSGMHAERIAKVGGEASNSAPRPLPPTPWYVRRDRFRAVTAPARPPTHLLPSLCSMCGPCCLTQILGRQTAAEVPKEEVSVLGDNPLVPYRRSGVVAGGGQGGAAAYRTWEKVRPLAAGHTLRIPSTERLRQA